MKSLILFLSLCLGLQCASPTWDEFPVAKISVHHREEDFSHLSQLQLAFKEALDTKQESLEISSYLRKNYGDETEALQEVRDLFFSVQSLPSYFIYRPEIRAYWQKQYSDQGLGFSSYEVRFDILPSFSDEHKEKEAWRRITKEIEDIALSIGEKQLPPAEQLEEIYRILSERAIYEKTEDLSSNNIYSCLFDGKTQCTGFSQSIYLITKSLGYPSRILHGYYEGGFHSWNQVMIQDRWYHMDLTADLDKRDKSYTTAYFLRGDKSMKDHRFSIKSQDEDYLKGYEEKGYLVQNQEELKELIRKLFPLPGTYHIALAKEMELHFLPLLAEELKADAYPYHHLSFEEAMGRLKLVIRNENQAAKNAKKE